MLAVGELKVFGSICSISYQLNIIPFQWDPITRQLSIGTSPARRIIYFLSRFYSTAYFAFAVIRIQPAYEGFGVKYPTYYPLYHAAQIVLNVFTVMFDTVIAAYVEDIVILFNQLVNMNKQLGRVNYNLNQRVRPC